MEALHSFVSTLWVVWFFLLFGGIVIWVMWPSRRREWQRRGEMILRDDEKR